MDNVKTSMFNSGRCYVYNKAIARHFNNKDAHTLFDEEQKYDDSDMTTESVIIDMDKEKEVDDIIDTLDEYLIDDDDEEMEDDGDDNLYIGEESDVIT